MKNPIIKLDQYIEGKPQKISQDVSAPVKIVPEIKIDAVLLAMEKSGNQVYAAGMMKALQILGLED